MKKVRKIATMLLIGGVIASNVTNAYAWSKCTSLGTVYNDSKKSINTTLDTYGRINNGKKSTRHQSMISAYDTYNSSNRRYHYGATTSYGYRSTARTGYNNYNRNSTFINYNL